MTFQKSVSNIKHISTQLEYRLSSEILISILINASRIGLIPMDIHEVGDHGSAQLPVVFI